MDVTTIGLDVAKQVFQVHGVDAHGQVVVRRQLRRKEVVAYFTKLPPCAISMEAGSSGHYWALRLRGLGHTVNLMAPQFVRPYVKTNKNDARDAEAICEAVTRPTMRFVPIKTVEQQTMLALHRARQGFVKARTAQANQLRSLLAEFGIVLPQGIHVLLRNVPAIVSDDENGLLASVRDLFTRLLHTAKSGIVT
jgi:transposase